jgi:selenocysteine lyase/cysteine desulfurase
MATEPGQDAADVAATDGDIDSWYREFPILDTWTYLDHATFGPLPSSHAQAATQAVTRMSTSRIGDIGATAALEELRADAANILRCGPDSVALLKATNEGVGLVAAGLDWRPGDEVVVYEREFSGTVAPWLSLQQQGVRVRVIADRGRARFDLADVAELLTPMTRVVCVSLVNSEHGFRAPVEEMARLCRPKGIWLVVDAVQAIGALDIAVAELGADIVAAHGYKFLLSGFGIAPVYCSQRALTELRVPLIGWKNAPFTLADADRDTALEESARKFESTLPSLSSISGMRASLRLLATVGMPTVQDRTLALVSQLADGLDAKGYQVISSRKESERSALLAARHSQIATTEVHEQLTESKIACAVRGGALRFSPHFYNQPSDIQRLLDALPC